LYISPREYADRIHSALFDNRLHKSIEDAANLIEATIKSDGIIYVCGNGGSAAIANHLVCDCQKGISTNTNLMPRIVSLASNVPIITAIANDIGYEDIFSHQLKNFIRPNDILLTISSSGNSPNVKNAIVLAQEKGNKVISFCGFDGGYSKKADVCVHVQEDNYGIVEDCHQSVMHMIAQNIRYKNLVNDGSKIYPF
jgi:phosphoheptose isomerase